MKKIIWPLLLMFLSACAEQVVERDLFTKHSDEYKQIQELATSRCKNESTIFTYLNLTNSFSTRFTAGTLYQIKDVKKTGETISDDDTFYAKIESIDTNANPVTMLIAVERADGSKIKFAFTESMNNAIIDGVGNAVCHPEEFFNSSNLDSSTSMIFEWNQENIIESDGDDADDIAERYELRELKGTLNASLPLFSLLYNRVITDTDKTNISSDAIIKTTTRTIAVIDDCDPDDDGSNNCTFSNVDATFASCTFAVNGDPTFYESVVVGHDLVSLSCP